MTVWQRARTALHLFTMGVRRRMVIGTRLVLIDNGRFLLLRHTYMPGWHFPGGGVEPAETAAECARREGVEETGFEAAGDLRLLGFYFKPTEATDRDHVAVYVADAFTQRHTFRPNGEIAEIGWFSPDALPTDIDPGTARRIREVIGGNGVSHLW